MNENNCPNINCAGVLNLIHTLHTVPVTMVGYCPQCKKEYYKLPSGRWVTYEEYRKFINEFR
jgi:hypothetical protein